MNIFKELVMGIIYDNTTGKLAVKAYETRQEMGKESAVDAAARINRIMERKDRVNAVFAAAPSQNEFLESLLDQKIDWNKIHAFHLDEYIGLDPDAPQGFGNFLKSAIFGRVRFAEVNYMNGNAPDPKAECVRYAKLLEENPPDIIFLGIGENGHLAFNDPAVADFDDPYRVKVVELDLVSRKQQVNDGCFRQLDEVPEFALTMTMPMIMSAAEAVAIVPGSLKKDAVNKTVLGEITSECPASILRRHPNAVLYLDRDSAADLL